MLGAPTANRSDLKITIFLKMTRSFVFKFRNKLEAKKKKHSKQSDVKDSGICAVSPGLYQSQS